MLMFILEAALRSIVMAAAVWAVIRLLRVQAVLAQKVAWVLVLAAAAVMPLVMHSPLLAIGRTVRIPLQGLSVQEMVARLGKLTPQSSAAQVQASPIVILQGAGSVHIPRQHSKMRVTTPATNSPRQSFLLHTDASQKAIESISEDSSRIVNLPIAPVEVSVKVPASIAGKAKFWTASRMRFGLILLYAAIVGTLLLRTIFGLGVAMRVLRRSKKVDGLFDEDGRAMRVRASSDLATPVTIGSIILLPSDYAAWDAEKLRVVLAHEQSHVRQWDFYLQLAAAVHAAIFWFSPLGWWLKRKLSDLGEALSDRAALEHAEDAASYAQVLLEFATAPKRAPLAGVAMARTSNLSSRIERILNDSRFRLAYLGGRRHAIMAAVLVPAALVAAVAGFRIVPAVHAERSANASAVVMKSFSKSSSRINTETGSTSTAQAIAPEVMLDSGVVVATAATGEIAQATAPIPPAAAPSVPTPPAADVVPPAQPEPPPSPDEDEDSSQDTTRHRHSHTVIHSDDDDDSFSIVHENGDGSVRWNGEYNDEVAKTRKKMGLKGDYIWFEREGKSYVITDPSIVAQADAMFREDPALERQQKAIEEKQKVLEKQMAEFDSDKAKIKVDTPEFKKQMADLNAQIAKIQSAEFKRQMDEINKQVNQEVLSKLQEQMGAIQEQIGQLQGQIGEQMGRYGEKQGELGEKMGELGEQMGRIGEEQGRRAEEASRKMQSVLDQALRNGKARPVE
jgi:beta-lactamase regulating signal transducer with metallopeptidase domain